MTGIKLADTAIFLGAVLMFKKCCVSLGAVHLSHENLFYSIGFSNVAERYS